MECHIGDVYVRYPLQIVPEALVTIEVTKEYIRYRRTGSHQAQQMTIPRLKQCIKEGLIVRVHKGYQAQD
jgi:hypothetical protein